MREQDSRILRKTGKFLEKLYETFSHMILKNLFEVVMSIFTGKYRSKICSQLIIAFSGIAVQSSMQNLKI